MSVDGGRARNGISVAGFTRARFVQLIRNGSRVPVAAQAKYLARYCEGLGAKTIVVEQRYVDRHYLDYPNLSKIPCLSG